jgi:DNA-binding NarL/FixJ family response regulator
MDFFQTAPKIQVLVADVVRMHGELLADALGQDSRLHVIGRVPGSRELLQVVAQREVDIVLVSSLLDEDPAHRFEVLRQLRSTQTKLQAIVLLESSTKNIVLDAFRAGARGIFGPHDSLEALCRCVRAVFDGQIWATPQELGFALETLSSLPVFRAVSRNGDQILTKRELEVVQCIAQGLTNRAIATQLGISQHTVKNYVFRVFDKLGVSNRLELLFLTLTSSVQSTGSLSADAGNGGFSKNPADHDSPEQRVQLGKRLEAGNGMTRDLAAAYVCYAEAIERISEMQRRLVRSMTAGEIMEAEQQLSSMLPNASSTPRINRHATEQELEAHSAVA